jgi:hypothetical protein
VGLGLVFGERLRASDVERRGGLVGMKQNNEQESLYDKIGQFITVPYSFIHNSRALSFHARWLFVALRYYTNGESGNAWPSYKTIQELTRMRREKINSSIKELEDAGWLERKKRFSNSTIYTLKIPRPEPHI